jgi:adenine deaminase
MPSLHASGTQACTVGTEHTLATITTPGVYRLRLGLGNLAAGVTADILIYRVLQKILVADAAHSIIDEGTVYVALLAGTGRGWESKPYEHATSIQFLITQTQGVSGKSVPWNITRADL